MIIQVKNLRINNETVESTHKITSPFPTFNWEYGLIDRVDMSDVNQGEIDKIYTNDPKGFEIRIGSSPISLGLDSFNGNVVSTGFIENKTLGWRYKGSVLRRNNTYYGQIKVTDSDDNVSPWKTFSFAYNNLPSVSDASITPTHPNIHDDLLLSYTYSDADGDTESGTRVWWFRNGVHERQFDNLTMIPSEFIAFDDEWNAQIFPSDGYEIGTPFTTFTVTVSTETPQVSNAVILPRNPTYNDPLFAKYSYTSPDANPDKSQFKWFKNGVLVPNATKPFARFEMAEGDEIHCEILPSDGLVEGTWVATLPVQIGRPAHRVDNLRVNGELEPYDSPLTPAVSWGVRGASNAPTRFQLRIGTAPEASNIYDTGIIASDQTVFSIPEGVLHAGRDYFVSVAVGDDVAFGKFSTVRMRTAGSHWSDTVSNSRGWTIESSLRVRSTDVIEITSSSSSSSSSRSDDYQGINIYDGTKYAQLRIYTDRISLTSGGTKEVKLDATNYASYTITGIGNDIKVFRNYVLILDGTGMFLSETNDKAIEFGTIGESPNSVGQYLNFFYTTSGAFDPSQSSSYYSTQYRTFLETEGSVDYLTGDSTDIFYAVSNESTKTSADVFRLQDQVEAETLQPERDPTLSMNSVKLSPNGKHAYFCHNNGLTVFENKVIDQFDDTILGTDNPVEKGWKLTQTSNLPFSNTNGIRINTTGGGKLFFSHSQKGTRWFDQVDNRRGWTVDFKVKLDDINDDSSGTTTQGPEGLGVYVNDGTYQEQLHFLKDGIVLVNAETFVSIKHDSFTNFRLTARGRNLKLFADGYLLADVEFSKAASAEGNASRPAIAEDNKGNLHAVWHDDGSRNRSIFYATAHVVDGIAHWQHAIPIVKETYNSTNPSIAVDSKDNLYVVFESQRSDSTDISMLVHNIFGWSKPFLIDSGQFDSFGPQIAIDPDDGLHVVWEDHREVLGRIMYRHRPFGAGQWTEVQKLSDENVDAQRPSIDVDGIRIVVSYTSRYASGLSDIWAQSKQISNASWDFAVQVSDSGVDADYSDVAFYDGEIYATWHDNKSGIHQIYGRRLTSSMAYIENPQQLTNGTTSCRFPSIGVKLGNDANTNNLYIAFETGGELDQNDGWTISDTAIAVAMYDQSLGRWLGSNQTHTVGGSNYGGFDVAITTDDTRVSRRPKIAKRIQNNAHILSEVDITSDDEYIDNNLTFTIVKDSTYDLTYISSYSIADVVLDRQVSGTLNRKEIRFGDYSDNYGADFTFESFSYYTLDSVEPFKATLLLEGTPTRGASIANTGEGWIASENGLSYFIKEEKRLAKFADGLFASGNIQDVAFDSNNVMYVVAAGRIYASYDHLNFYQKFEYITTARSITFDSNNYLWVGTSVGVYRIDVWEQTYDIPRVGTSVPQSPDGTPSVTSSSSSSGESTGGGTAGGREIKSETITGQTQYAIVVSQNILAYNQRTQSFEEIQASNWSDYVIPMTEIDGLNGTYVADFPTSIKVAATYITYIYLQQGSSPSPSDQKLQQGTVEWDGSKEVGYVPVEPGDSNDNGTPSISNPDVFECEINDAEGFVVYNTGCGLVGNDVRKVYADSRNQIWVATSTGLSMIRDSRVFSYTRENSGLSSNDVRDIAIVNSAVRYVATTSGLTRMHGSTFESISFNDADWSEDVTAIAWASPNTLWMGAGGNVVQLFRDPITEEYSFSIFRAEDYANYSIVENCKNSQRFSFGFIDNQNVKQVLVNGRDVRNGYRIGSNSLVFDSPLLSSDKVEIINRKDIQRWATLQQNKAEKVVYGDVFRSVKKMLSHGSDIYGITTGDKSQIVKYDSSVINNLPYDSIVLDTTPPEGGLEFVEQIDGSLVRLRITDPFDNLSGIKDMIISNYPNLTSDGETPLDWTPFREEFEFDLGADFGNVFTQLEFTSGKGRRISKFGEDIYAGTAEPANIYRYNPVSKAWQLAATVNELVTESAIEFMIEYKDAFYVGVSSPTGGSLWESSNGSDWSKIIDYPGTPHAATVINNRLYIGTDGDEGGQLFTFDGVNSVRLAKGIGSAVYALHAAQDVVYIGTGENGILYRWDPAVSRLLLMVNDRDTQITAIGSALINPPTATVTNPPKEFYLFAGGGTKGRIIKSVNGSPFNLSLLSIPTKVTQMKVDAIGQLHAVVGRNVYKYKNRSWAAVYTNTTTIEDIHFDQEGFNIVYEGGIKRINNDKGSKKVYLSLRDVAGNASRIPGTGDVSGGETIITDIDINDLVGFVNQNRILELNEYGERLWSYEGEESFYSADKVIVEEGEYFSEIFNGTSDHVTWESIYWDAVVPEGTDLNISVRTGDSRSDLLTSPFTKTFTKEQFEGADISNLSGQFIQFRVSLSTSVRGRTPRLYGINLRSRTRASVHFFTTNFVLPSRVKGGILTAQTFVPFAADIVFGINTNDSTEFHEYQIIKPDTLFKVEDEQAGKNLRVGIKLISPLNVEVVTENLEQDNPYSADVWNNIIEFNFTNPYSDTRNFYFNVELFEDASLDGEAFSTIHSGENASVFAVNDQLIDDTGVSIAAGESVNVLVALKGNISIRCNEFYYAKVSAFDGSNINVIDDTHAFISNCNPNYANTISFDYTNITGSSIDADFRIKFYADATRTTHIATYFSGQDQGGWKIDGIDLASPGYEVLSGQTVSVEFTPELGALTDDNYHIDISYFDGNDFVTISRSNMVNISNDAEYACGEYINVPIVKDIALQLELDEFTEEFGSRERRRRTFQFNLKGAPV